MSLNRLEASADLNNPQARGLLHETLELLSNEIRRQREELTAVRESDRRVAPVPIEGFPFPMGPVSAGSDVDLGTVIFRAAGTIPPYYLEANGQAVSRTAFAALFDLMGTTHGIGDGSTTFNLPNVARRYIMGRGGSSANGVNNSLGATGGSETSNALLAHTHTGPSHTHDLSNHTHDHSHTHDMGNHTHGVTAYTVGGGATAGIAYGASGGAANSVGSAGPNTNVTGTPSVVATSVPSANVTSAAGTGATGSAGSGTSFAILPPTIVLVPLIRVNNAPDDVAQTAPVAWGPVPGRADLAFRSEFPAAALTGSFALVEDGKVPEPVVVASAIPSALAGTMTLRFTGLTRVPYNFRGFKTQGVRIWTKMNLTGCAALTSGTCRLKVVDPVAGSGYLPTVYTRTVPVSAGTIADATFIEAKLSKDDLGPDWRAGYALQFELSFEVPKTYSTIELSVGALLVSW